MLAFIYYLTFRCIYIAFILTDKIFVISLNMATLFNLILTTTFTVNFLTM